MEVKRPFYCSGVPDLKIDHQNENLFILDLADQSIGTDPILPATCQLPSQRDAISARIIFGADPFPQVVHDFCLDLTIELD